MGADPSMLLQFPRQYPEARVFPLEQNHRSTGVVVALSNALAAPLATGLESWTANPQGPAARLYVASDELDEARFAATEIRRLLDSGQIEHPGQVAVLYRTNAQARSVAVSLRSVKLPFPRARRRRSFRATGRRAIWSPTCDWRIARPTGRRWRA